MSYLMNVERPAATRRARPAEQEWRELAVGRDDRAGLFLGLFFGLVARAGATGSTDRATDDRAGRTGDRATDDRTGDAAGQTAGTRAALVVAFGGLTGDRATDGADRAADNRARRATDGHADACAREGTRACAEGFLAALFVLDGGAVVSAHHPWLPGLVVDVARLTVAWIKLLVSHVASPVSLSGASGAGELDGRDAPAARTHHQLRRAYQ